MRRGLLVTLGATGLMLVGCSGGEAEPEWAPAVHALAEADFFGSQDRAEACLEGEPPYDANVSREQVIADTTEVNDSYADPNSEFLDVPLTERARMTGEVPDDVTDEEILEVWGDHLWSECVEATSE